MPCNCAGLSTQLKRSKTGRKATTFGYALQERCFIWTHGDHRPRRRGFLSVDMHTPSIWSQDHRWSLVEAGESEIYQTVSETSAGLAQLQTRLSEKDFQHDLCESAWCRHEQITIRNVLRNQKKKNIEIVGARTVLKSPMVGVGPSTPQRRD